VKKNKLLFWLMIIIIFGLYNMFVFMFTEEKTNVFWLAYGATALAFVLLIPAYFISYGLNTTMRSVFYGSPLMIISTVYIVVQIIAGAIIMLLSGADIKVVITIEAVILGLYLILALVSLIGRGMVEGIDANAREKVGYIKSLEDYVLSLRYSVGDPATQDRLNKLWEAIRFSDPMSHPSLEDLERAISSQIGVLAGQLGNPAESGRLFDELGSLIEQRNRKCKMLK